MASLMAARISAMCCWSISSTSGAVCTCSNPTSDTPAHLHETSPDPPDDTDREPGSADCARLQALHAEHAGRSAFPCGRAGTHG